LPIDKQQNGITIGVELFGIEEERMEMETQKIEVVQEDFTGVRDAARRSGYTRTHIHNPAN